MNAYLQSEDSAGAKNKHRVIEKHPGFESRIGRCTSANLTMVDRKGAVQIVNYECCPVDMEIRE
jgi:hypothetical protein